MSRVIGYVRVSTADQDPALQRDALADIGVTEIFSDTTSGANPKRPGLKNALNALEKGDTLVVWRLDRLGRSMRQLVDTAEEIQNKGAHLKSVTETIDTTTAGGRVLFQFWVPLPNSSESRSASASPRAWRRRSATAATLDVPSL